ncbi:MAG: phage major capsid protein [Acutalibacteraceae bacterium]
MSFCDSIRLEKGMYNVRGKSFTEVLEELDPSENYKGTPLAGLDAYERQLKRFNIKVKGPACDKIEKFFSTTDSAVLFPEFISRAIKQGLESFKTLSEIVAATSLIDGVDYRSIVTTTSESQTNSGTSAYNDEATQIKKITVKHESDLTKLKKYGRVLSSSYEAMRFQNLDVMAVIFKQIGKDLAYEQLGDLITAIKPESDSVSTETASTISYSDLVKLLSKFGSYTPNVIIGASETIAEILNLSEIKNIHIDTHLHGCDKFINPACANIITHESLKTSSSETLLVFDKDFAVQMIQSGNITVEYDKIIDQQLNQAAISVIRGFSPICSGAIYSLGVTQS